MSKHLRLKAAEKKNHPGWAKYEKKQLLKEKIEHYEKYSDAAEYKEKGLKLIYTPMGNKR